MLDPDDERRKAARTDLEAAPRGGGRPRRAPCEGREHPRDAVRDPAADGTLRRALRRGGEAARREDGLRVHAAGRERPRPGDGAHGRPGRRRTERGARDRHLAHGEARDLGGRPAAVPGHLFGWVELSDGQWENMPDPVDETINHRALPGEGEFPIREYVAAVARRRLRGAVGRRGALGRSSATLPIEQIFAARTAAPRSSELCACSLPAAGRIRLPHRLDVGHRADDSADLRLHVRLDGRLRGAAVLLAPDERHLGAGLGVLRVDDASVSILPSLAL